MILSSWKWLNGKKVPIGCASLIAGVVLPNVAAFPHVAAISACLLKAGAGLGGLGLLHKWTKYADVATGILAVAPLSPVQREIATAIVKKAVALDMQAQPTPLPPATEGLSPVKKPGV